MKVATCPRCKEKGLHLLQEFICGHCAWFDENTIYDFKLNRRRKFKAGEKEELRIKNIEKNIRSLGYDSHTHFWTRIKREYKKFYRYFKGIEK